MKAVLVDGYEIPERGKQLQMELFQANGVEFRIENCKTPEEIVERCSDADVILNVYRKMDARVIGRLPQCRGLVRYGIGYDVFDVEAATRLGIPVCNIPAYCIPEVAAHTLALLLAASRQLVRSTLAVRAGLWNKGPGQILMRRPSAQTLGLLGFGHIAREVARLAAPLGYHILAYDPFLPQEVFDDAGADRADLDGVIRGADILSCHTPLNKDTFHLLDRERFAQMKDGVIIVNTSRGGVICEADLIDALRSGKVAAAGLDVVETEPLPAGHPFSRMDNVVLSPHAAYDSYEASTALYTQAAETAVKLLRGEIPENTVNQRALGR